jgi:hypothetical protein
MLLSFSIAVDPLSPNHPSNVLKSISMVAEANHDFANANANANANAKDQYNIELRQRRPLQ